MNYAPGYFKGKKITLMGLGLLGRGIGDAKFFAEEGADLIVTDLKSGEELASSLEALKGFSNIQFVLGVHRLEDFRNRDFILKSADVKPGSPYIEEARKNGIPIEQSSAIFASLTSATVIGITGTRGKSTTTMLVYSILKEAGKDVFLGGNVRGMSTLPLVRTLKAGDIAVLELDSWQLQGFGERKISPHISVFTNFMADHQNYYKNNMEAYFADKANIFINQKEGDTLVVGRELWEARKSDIEGHTKAKIVVADEENVPLEWKAGIPGVHNRKNIACAIEAVHAFGIDDTVVRAAVESFAGVEGRLQFVKEAGGVKIYNDTTSTTPDAALAGLEALAKDKNIVLIMGGADKQLNMSKLVQSLDFYCKKIVLLPGTGTDKLKEFGIDDVSTPIGRAETLEDAFSKARESAKPGDIILFSPAFASFGMFKNEYDRGEKFLELVNNIKE